MILLRIQSKVPSPIQNTLMAAIIEIELSFAIMVQFAAISDVIRIKAVLGTYCVDSSIA